VLEVLRKGQRYAERLLVAECIHQFIPQRVIHTVCNSDKESKPISDSNIRHSQSIAVRNAIPNAVTKPVSNSVCLPNRQQEHDTDSFTHTVVELIWNRVCVAQPDLESITDVNFERVTSATQSQTSSSSGTASESPTPSQSGTVSPTLTRSQSPSESATASSTQSPSISSSSSQSQTASATQYAEPFGHSI